KVISSYPWRKDLDADLDLLNRFAINVTSFFANMSASPTTSCPFPFSISQKKKFSLQTNYKLSIMFFLLFLLHHIFRMIRNL
ncbi:hypothetical protein BpHYR1_018411, partial [Brachionus plicatilis]